MGKRRQPPTYRMDQFVGHKPDPLVRVIAAHPTEQLIAACVAGYVRVLDCKTGEHFELAGDAGHKGAIRFVSISPDGQFLLTGSDDKTCKLWSLDKRTCLASWRMHKKLSAGAFTSDSKHALFADKFGDVAVAAVGQGEAAAMSAEPELLLGHLCSIVTSVLTTPDNKYVVTADRDGRVRISPLPQEPLKGAYEIQAYCLGHQNFVTSAACAATGTGTGQAVLVTGSGDGSVRVWELDTGKLLSTYIAAAPRTAQPPAQAGQQQAEGEGQEVGEEEQEGSEEGGAGSEAGDADGGGTAGGGGGGGDADVSLRKDAPDCASVQCVAVSRDGTAVAVVVEGEQEVQVLRLDPATHQLSLIQKHAVSGVAYPCDATWDTAGRLWVVGGPPLDTSTSLHLAVLTVAGDQVQDITSEVLSPELQGKLEQRKEEEEAKLATGELVVELNKALQRKKYDEQEVSDRKRARNDTRESLRLAILRGEIEPENK